MSRSNSKVLRKLWDAQSALCAYCRRATTMPNPLPPVTGPLTATLDHREPRAAGGTGEQHNLVMACSTCNTRKGSMSWSAWVNYMRSYPRWFEGRIKAASPHQPEPRI